MAITAGTTSSAQLCFGDSGDDNIGQIEYNNSTNSMALYTNASERMRIDSSGHTSFILGTNAMGTFSDSIGEVGSGNFALQVTNSAGSALKPLGFRAEDIRFATGSTERMRIDSSGRVGIGTTNADPSFGTTTGSSLQPSGQTHHSSSGTSLVLNRTASDGTIAQFRKGGTTVGSIGAVSGQVYMADTAAGLRFSGQGADDVSPCNGSGADKDNSVDLGQTSNRFKDVHAVNYYGDGSNLTGVGGSTAYGAVGTYIWAHSNSNVLVHNTTIAGSNLTALGAITAAGSNVYLYNITSGGLSGTWRSLGGSNDTRGGHHRCVALFVRVS